MGSAGWVVLGLPDSKKKKRVGKSLLELAQTLVVPGYPRAHKGAPAKSRAKSSRK